MNGGWFVVVVLLLLLFFKNILARWKRASDSGPGQAPRTMARKKERKKNRKKKRETIKRAGSKEVNTKQRQRHERFGPKIETDAGVEGRTRNEAPRRRRLANGADQWRATMETNPSRKNANRAATRSPKRTAIEWANLFFFWLFKVSDGSAAAKVG